MVIPITYSKLGFIGERTGSEIELGTTLFGEQGTYGSNTKVIRYVTTEGLNQEVLQSYTCIFDEVTKLFFVNIGMYGVRGFQQSTYINSVKLAEMKGANKVFFIVNRSNKDTSEYRKAFKLIDLKRVSTDEKKTIFKADNDYLVYARELN